MDTSPEYIKMCEKAGEIQRVWKPIPGDFSVWPNKDVPFSSYEDPYDGVLVHATIWLPRQDQLQEMITHDFYRIPLIENFYSFCLSIHRADKGNLFKSMEQLWLAFVMKVKYGKVWDGEEWRVA